VPVEIMLFTKKDCPNCPGAKKIMGEIEAELGERIVVKRYDLDDEEDFLTALQHQVMSTPSVVVGERLVSAGRAPTRDEILEAVSAEENG
jgi:glutaredoxin